MIVFRGSCVLLRLIVRGKDFDHQLLQQQQSKASVARMQFNTSTLEQAELEA